MRARIKSMQRILALKILTAPGVGGENCSSHHRTKSGTPLRPKAARVEPHTHTKRRPKRHAGNFLWSLASGMTRGRVRTYVAFYDILTCSNFCAAASQGRARNRVSLLTRVAQATRVEVK